MLGNVVVGPVLEVVAAPLLPPLQPTSVAASTNEMKREVAARTRGELRSEELDVGIGLEPAPAVELREPANSGPGEIYPSFVDVPLPGCWTFTLRWHGHTDTIDLPYGLPVEKDAAVTGRAGSAPA